MEEFEDSLTPQEQLKAENELLRLKLIAEKGAKFGDNPDMGLDPGVENEWLNYIQNFEERHKNAKKISVYDFIGRPAYTKAQDLDDASLEVELDRLLKIMGENGVALDWLDGYYNASVIYKFVTEELFIYEKDDIRMPGMVTHFTYEEFHSNHDYDLRQAAEEFIRNLLGRKWDKFEEYALCDKIVSAANIEMSVKDFSAQVNLFQNAWAGFEINRLEVSEVNFNIEQETAKAVVTLDYTALAKNGESEIYAGLAVLRSRWQYGYWYISQVSVPGFNS